MTMEPRANRFVEPSAGSSVEAGIREASQFGDGMDRKFVRRNLKPYKTLKRYSKSGGLRKLRNKNMAQLESIAAKAVLSKANVKRKKLDTTVNRGSGKGQHRKKNLQRAARILAKTPNSYADYAIKKNSIPNKRTRRALVHLRQIRRNRRVMKQPKFSSRAYDIWKGYVRK